MHITHYIYVEQSRKDDADALTAQLIAAGFDTKLSHLDYGGGQWSIIVTVDANDLDDATLIEGSIVAIAEMYDAEYDGSETEVG